MRFRIELTKAAAREVTSVPKAMLKRLDSAIFGLAEDPLPPGVKKLRNSGGMYRIRVSDYRIIYKIEQELVTILVVRIGHPQGGLPLTPP